MDQIAKQVTEYYRLAKAKKAFGQDEKAYLGKFLLGVRISRRMKWSLWCKQLPFGKWTANQYIRIYKETL